MAKKARTTVKVKDNGLRNYRRTLAALDRSRAKVGIQGVEASKVHDSESGSTLTNVMIATIHEFGDAKSNIPERSFLRSTADKKRRKLLGFLKRNAELALKQRNPTVVRSGLLKVGESLRKEIVTRMVTNAFGRKKPLKASTVEQRRIKSGRKTTQPSDFVALVDTGVLMGSISVDVDTKASSGPPLKRLKKP